jgi:UDP-N-acetylglucosamine acyltransferase
MISDKADIHPSAMIAEGVTVGPWTVIGPHVSIGTGTRIGPHVVVQQHTRIGENNVIHPYAMIGGDPQDIAYHGEETWLEIGDNNVIREYVSIHRGSLKDEGVTLVGDHNLIFAYSHIAHDCVIGSHTTFFNHATLAGHCTIENHAIIGAFAALHQFCRVGSYSFLARAAQVPKDVPAFLMVVYNPGRPCGLNMMGLKRAGFTLATIKQLKKAYQTLYQDNLPLADALAKLKDMVTATPQVQMMVDVIEQAKRGIVR